MNQISYVCPQETMDAMAALVDNIAADIQEAHPETHINQAYVIAIHLIQVFLTKWSNHIGPECVNIVDSGVVDESKLQ